MSKTFTLDEVNALELSAADNATILERERIINVITDFSLQFATDSKTPLEKMMIENYQMISLFIVGLIKGDVENFLSDAITFIKGENK